MKTDIKKFGAVGDGFTLDTAAIQRAIDCCAESGDELIISAGVYLTGTLLLKSHLKITVEKDAIILGSANFEDYKGDIRPFIDAVNQERGRCLICGENVEDVTIKGEGIFDGRGAAFHEKHPEYGKRPFLFRLIGCQNLKIEDILVRNSAAWCMHFLDCEEVTLTDVRIISRVNHNNDGIDIDSCRNFVIQGCAIDTGDDGICLKATIDKPCEHVHIEGCTISSRWAAFKIGTESYGDFSNIIFRNNRIYDTEGCGIKIVPVDGANVENLEIENITLSNTTGPIFIALGERLRTYFKECPPKKPGTMKNIVIRGIQAEVVNAEGFRWHPRNADEFVTYDGIWGNGKGCVTISGTPQNKIQNVVMEDFKILLPGGEKLLASQAGEVIEMEKRYPEFHVFGTLPSSGLFIRHVDGLYTKNISLSLKEADVRQLTCYHDVENMVEEI